MADQYDALADRLGIPPNQRAAWRAVSGAPPAPAPSSLGGDFPMPPAAAFEGPDAAPPNIVTSGNAHSAVAPWTPAPPSGPADLSRMMPGTPIAPPPPTPGAPPSAAPAMAPAPGGKVPWNAPKPAAPPPTGAPSNLRGLAQQFNQQDRTKNLDGATFADGSPPIDGSLVGKPVLVDAGGRRPAAWQVQEGTDLGPEADRAHTRAGENAQAAADLDFMSGQKAAEFERGYLDKYNTAAEKYALEQNSRTEQFQRAYDDSMGHLDEIRGQIREAKIDPFGGMNAGVSRIGQAIAIGLGAFAAHRTGENQALAAIKHSSDMIMRQQEEGIAKLERGAKGETNFLGMLKQQYGDIDQAKAAARIAYLEAAKTELAKQLGSPDVADPRLLAGYERLNAKLDDELVQRESQFRAITKDRVVRHDVNAPARYAGGAVEDKEAKGDARYMSEAYQKAGIPASLSQLKDVDRSIDALGDGDIPGVGVIEGKIPSVLMSDRSIAGRQSLAAVKNSIGHSIFGGALSPTEASKLNEQLEGANDAASLRRTVQALRQSLQMQAANIAAGSTSKGVDYYEGHGGSVQRGTSGSQRQVSLDKPAAPYVKEAQ